MQIDGQPGSRKSDRNHQDEAIWQMSLAEVASLVESRQLSPITLTRMMLARIESLDSHLCSYATVMAEQALEAAKRAEEEVQSGFYRGPLHGIPIAIKDLIYTQGVPTMAGSGALADFIPDYDATVVNRLADAGAILLGKLNLSEGAMLGYHKDFKVPVNPWDGELWAGASSSGSGVATAAGLCFASLGTDTGGSIRVPSSANGVVGLKPTYGRVSLHGVLELASTLDHVGPITRTVEDAAIMLDTLAGFDPQDRHSLDVPVPNIRETLRLGSGQLEGLSIGFDPHYASIGVDPDLVSAIDSALSELTALGAKVDELSMPEFTPSLEAALFHICSYEALRAHAPTYPSRKADYGAFFSEFLALGQTITDEMYGAALTLREAYSQSLYKTLEKVDAVVLPSCGVPFSIPVEALQAGMKMLTPFMQNAPMRFTVPANYAGVPTISLPCGVSRSGIPHSIQFMGGRFTESMLCHIAYAYEQVTQWHRRQSPYMSETRV